MKNIPTQEELNPTLKRKKTFLEILKTIGLFILPIVIKNQKRIKGTEKEQVVDDVFDVLRKL